jgi:2-desacetyl-2-hydroxyethyl bacteriochlorophyllide A dehydrogenase
MWLMKAAVIKGPGNIRAETVDTPSIKKAKEILVKVAACGICGSDIQFYKKGPASIPKGRTIIGHEWSGEVVEVGSAVKNVTLGSRITGTGFSYCGECEKCRKGIWWECPEQGLPGYGMDGAMAEYVVVPNPMPKVLLFELPETMTYEEAAVIEPMAISGWAVEEAHLKPNQTVVVLGAGPIGLGALQFAKVEGAKVIVSEPSAKRLALARKLGADEVIDPTVADPVEVVKEFTSGKWADVVIECSGIPNVFYQGLDMLHRSGKVMQIANFGGGLHLSPELMHEKIMKKNLSVQWTGGLVWSKAFELVSKGKINTKDLISHEFKLDDVKQAFEMQLNAAESIKVIIKP